MSKTWQIILTVCALAAGFLLGQGVKSCEGPDEVSDLEKKIITLEANQKMLLKNDSIKDERFKAIDKRDSIRDRKIEANHQSDKNEKAHTNSVADNKLQAYTDSILRSDKGLR
jgi:hypothetical protein